MVKWLVSLLLLIMLIFGVDYVWSSPTLFGEKRLLKMVKHSSSLVLHNSSFSFLFQTNHLSLRLLSLSLLPHRIMSSYWNDLVVEWHFSNSNSTNTVRESSSLLIFQVWLSLLYVLHASILKRGLPCMWWR